MIKVLRLGHRLGRDARISTHCGLVARAFGAEEIIFSGDKDTKMMNSIENVSDEWGGDFFVRYEKNWKKIVEDFRGVKIHLTMYGIPLQKKIKTIKKEGDLLVIVGGEKVPGEIYNITDYNIAVTNQPHSEIAALSVFLHEYMGEKYVEKKFKKARMKVVPQKRGKKVKNL